MIIGFRHKRLEAFYNTGTTRGVQLSHVKKIRNILELLDVAAKPKAAMPHLTV
jgi:proteic killer suppression protein